MEYLLQEAEFNLFIIGKIENYGYDASFQTIWGMVDRDNNIHGVLFKYYSSFIPYSYNELILEKFIPLINLGAKVVSGKKEIIDVIKKYLSPDRIKEEKNDVYAHLKCLNSLNVVNYEIKKAEETDVERLINLRKQIEEFKNISVNKKLIKQKINSGSGRIYYIENELGEMISSASTSSENKLMAMIVGVATLPEYRNRGFATSCVYRLCRDLLAEGKNPCLFYDNPEAGKIYNKIGFTEIGRWSILQFNI